MTSIEKFARSARPTNNLSAIGAKYYPPRVFACRSRSLCQPNMTISEEWAEIAKTGMHSPPFRPMPNRKVEGREVRVTLTDLFWNSHPFFSVKTRNVAIRMTAICYEGIAIQGGVVTDVN